MKAKWNLWLPVLMMLVFACTRWPGLLPPNFSAFYALAFCAGVYFPARLAWWLPLATIITTDVALNLFYYHTSAIGAFMLVNYFAYGGLIWLGRRYSPSSSWLGLLTGGIIGAILFYVVTNTASWLQNPEYPKTLAGWCQALSSGIPGLPPTWTFFRNTLLSGGVFTALFTGAMKASEAAESAQEKEQGEEDEAQDAGEEQPEKQSEVV